MLTYAYMERMPSSEGAREIDQDWENAFAKLGSSPADRMVVEVTSSLGRADLEKYLEHNLQTLSENQKNFILASLRAKNLSGWE